MIGGNGCGQAVFRQPLNLGDADTAAAGERR